MRHTATRRLFWVYTGLAVLGVVLVIAGGALAGKSGVGGIIGGSIVGVIGGAAIILAGLVELVTWIGALIHIARHGHWRWFAVVLLLTWTWFAMLAYVLAGPKDARVPAEVRG